MRFGSAKADFAPRPVVEGRSRWRDTLLGVHIVAATIGMFAGVRYLLKPLLSGISAGTPATSITPTPRLHYFHIHRTQIELGYTYWVLHGFGCFHCFELYDTWREACDQASQRVMQASATPPLALTISN